MTQFSLSDGRLVHLIGDPHLGRKFETGVPQHRRGERETSQFVHFVEELNTEADIIVMVGDLFDQPTVPKSVAVAAAGAVMNAAENNPDTLYYMMAGNHDQPRNVGVVGAWPVFRKISEDRFLNLRIVTHPLVDGPLAFFPWEWDKTALEQIMEASGVEAVVGHWDTVAFGDKTDHLVPAAALHAAYGDITIWTGHEHTPGECEVESYLVTKTGSMEPYTHGEDPTGSLYLTLTREEALLRDDLGSKYVRVILAPGEELPDIDCMGLTHLRSQAEEDQQITLSIDDFDWHKLLKERIETLDPLVQDFINERIGSNGGAEE